MQRKSEGQLGLGLPLRSPHGVDVVGLGQNSLDLMAIVREHPAPDSKQSADRLLKLPGGQVASALVACARQGWRTRYLGRIGADEHGAIVRAALEAEGVDLAYLSTADAETHAAIILVDPARSHRTIVWTHDPRLAMRAADVPAAAVAGCRVLIVDGQEPDAARAAARLARTAGLPVVLDVEAPGEGIDALVRDVDVLIAARTFPLAYTGARSMGEALRVLEEQTRAPVVMVTLGEEGALARSGGRELHVPAFPVDVVDTTGAGDAFRGGFVARWLAVGEGAELADLMRYGAATAALKCRAMGAQTALPTRADVEDFVTGRGRTGSKDTGAEEHNGGRGRGPDFGMDNADDRAGRPS